MSWWSSGTVGCRRSPRILQAVHRKSTWLTSATAETIRLDDVAQGLLRTMRPPLHLPMPRRPRRALVDSEVGCFEVYEQ